MKSAGPEDVKVMFVNYRTETEGRLGPPFSCVRIWSG
jgi:hypothetical protein